MTMEKTDKENVPLGHGVVLRNPYARNKLDGVDVGVLMQHSTLPLLTTTPTTNSAIPPLLEVTMGNQSQKRNGSIKTMKKKATQAKHKKRRTVQTGIDGSQPFERLRDCVVCRAMNLRASLGNTVAIPHRAHHRLCIKNKKTKGLSERTVEIEKACQQNLAINAEPVQHIFAPGSYEKDFFVARQRPASKRTTNEYASTPATNTKKGTANNAIDDLASNLSKTLQERHTNPNLYPWLRQCRAPPSIAHAFDFILGEFEHKRKRTTNAEGLPSTSSFYESHEKYQQYFGHQNCLLTFPPEKLGSDNKPNPFYHGLVGLTIFPCWPFYCTSYMNHRSLQAYANSMGTPLRAGRPPHCVTCPRRILKLDLQTRHQKTN